MAGERHPQSARNSKSTKNHEGFAAIQTALTRGNPQDATADHRNPSRVKDSSSVTTSPAPACALPNPVWTSSLSKSAVRRIINAVGHAETIGCPLNRFTTINWDVAGIDNPKLAQRKILKLAYDWLQKSGAKFAHVWVMEHGSVFGLHTHFLFHVPPHLMPGWNRLMAGWLRQAGLKRARGVSLTRPIGRGYGEAFADASRREAYRLNLITLTEYILKGATSTARHIGRISRPPKYGPVEGRRFGTSRNLFPAAILTHRSARKGSKASHNAR